MSGGASVVPIPQTSMKKRKNSRASYASVLKESYPTTKLGEKLMEKYKKKRKKREQAGTSS